MEARKIIQHPNTTLRKKNIPTKSIRDAKEIVDTLIKSLINSKQEGIGLSAPQIGINKRVFIAKKIIFEGEKEKQIVIAFVNPTIVKGSREKGKSLEGCLSISDTYGYVNRHRKVKVEYTDLEGNRKTFKTGGYLSYVIQHEQDHLDGILFIDKLIDNKIYTEQEIDKKLNLES